MPPFSAAPRRVGNSLSVQFRDFTGKPSTMSGTVSAAATAGEISALVVAAGNVSNARVMEQRVSSFSVQVSDTNPLNTAFDEAYADVGHELILLFQADATGEVRDFHIPAPDAIMFAADGITPVTADAGAAAGSGALLMDNLIEAFLTALGAGFTFARAYKNNSGRRARSPLAIAEPTGNPGDAPGL